MNFKKWIVACSILTLPLGVASFSEAAVEKGSADNVHVQVNGNNIKMDVPGFVQNDRTLVPLRAVTEAFGADVQWDEANQIATVTLNEISVKLKLGSNQATILNKDTNFSLTVTLDVPAQSINYRTMVPLRFVSESFSSEVAWDGDNYTAIIKRDDSTIPTTAQIEQYFQSAETYFKEFDSAGISAGTVLLDRLSQKISYDTFVSRIDAELNKMDAASAKLENLSVPNHPIVKTFHKDTVSFAKEALAYNKKVKAAFRPDGSLDQDLLVQLESDLKALTQKQTDYKNKYTNYVR